MQRRYTTGKSFYSKFTISLITKILLLLALVVFPSTACVYAQIPIEEEIARICNAGVTGTLNIKHSGFENRKVDLDILKLYQSRQFTPIWIGDDEPSAKALAALKAIEAAFDDGLNPQDYFVSEIKNRLDVSSAKDFAELDIVITLGVSFLISDAGYGRLALRQADRQQSTEINIKTSDLAFILQQAISSEDIAQHVARQFPQHRQYQRMKSALAEYRTIAARGGWPSASPGAAIIYGASGPRVQALMSTLSIMGDLPVSLRPKDKFDEDVKAAVMSFQQRHGLPITGEVHEKTIQALNVPVQDRIGSLIINLERWRWLKPDFSPNKEVYVNIAGYELFALDAGVIKLRLPVIVGKNYQATPVFGSEIKHIEFNPYWNVPNSIARNEILPKLRADSKYLAGQKMQILERSGKGLEISAASVNWNKLPGSEMGRYMIRQKPGAWNALGTMKFIFPNEHSVYLHDTPNRNLFTERNRAFSHGCIRVDRPSELAVFLLNRPSDQWDLVKIEKLIASGKTEIVKLPETVPIYITYRTAWVDQDMTVNFRPDIYGRDVKVLARLARGGGRS